MFIVGASQRGGRLTIRDSQQRHSGRYVCTVYLVNGERSTGYASLTVEGVGQLIIELVSDLKGN